MRQLTWEEALAIVTNPDKLKIRPRTIQHRTRGYVEYVGEYQIVEGRNIIWRADFREQAEEFIAEAKAKGG